MSLPRVESPNVSSAASQRTRSDMPGDIGSPPSSPGTDPVHAFPSLSVQVPSSSCLSVQLPPVNSSFGQNRLHLPAPVGAQGDNDRVPYDKKHDPGRRRSYATTRPKAVLEARAATTDAVEWKRNCDVADAVDNLGTLSGKRNRAADDAMDISGDSPPTQEKRCTRQRNSEWTCTLAGT